MNSDGERNVHMVAADQWADLLEGGHMIKREMLERKIYQLRQIIRADAYTLASKSTPHADKAAAEANSDTHHHVGRPVERDGASSQDTAEPRGPRAQAKAYPRSKTHEGRVAANPDSPARPH